MLSTTAESSRLGVRGLLVALSAFVVLFVVMPGLRDAFTAGAVAISIAGGVVVGIAALAARAGRCDRQMR